MIRTKQLVANPEYNPDLPKSITNQNLKWEYGYADGLKVGDVVVFLCNGRGRGGHFQVTARVTKVNKKTFKATELPRSYYPGTLWTVNYTPEMEDRFGEIHIHLSWKE